MIEIRRADERGHADHGWLDTRHTFSFAQYHEPRYMGFRTLRVINEDRVQPNRGFGTHAHRDMEILTYVVDGGLEHRDSMNNGSVIRPGDVQRMSAGTGVTHSEINASLEEVVHLLQIWILPDRRGIEPSYEQKHFPPSQRRDRLRLVASGDGRDGSVRIHQDADVYAALLADGARVHHALAPQRGAWIQVVRGEIALGDETLHAGDGAAIVATDDIELASHRDSEVLLFDLA